MTLKINNKVFDYFNGFAVQLRFDAVASAFSFSVYFDPENADHKLLLKPLKYARAVVEHNGEVLITGTILNHTFKSGPQKSLVLLSGYSLPGVLEDCEITPSVYPLQSDGLTLKEIAEKLCKPFNISVAISESVKERMDKTFDVSDAKETQSVKSYLTELAAQKNIILTHTSVGALLFTEAKADQKPFFHFENNIPGTEYSLSVNGQGMHKDITVLKQASDVEGANAGEETITNPFVSAFRSKVVVQSSGTDIETQQAAKNIRADELKNIKLSIATDRWEIDGKIVKPNSIISVHNNELFIYNKTNFFVESVSLKGDSKETTATLECVLPAVYNGREPVNIFN